MIKLSVHWKISLITYFINGKKQNGNVLPSQSVTSKIIPIIYKTPGHINFWFIFQVYFSGLLSLYLSSTGYINHLHIVYVAINTINISTCIAYIFMVAHVFSDADNTAYRFYRIHEGTV